MIAGIHPHEEKYARSLFCLFHLLYKIRVTDGIRVTGPITRKQLRFLIKTCKSGKHTNNFFDRHFRS